MFMGLQTLPVVYVDNLTEHTLENLCFFFDGNPGNYPRIKKMKSGDRKLVPIYNKGFTEKRVLYLTYYNKKLKINEYQAILDELTDSFIRNILVEIKAVNRDGRFKLTINDDYIAQKMLSLLAK